MSHKPIPISERFWKKIEKTEGCWLWKGATYPKGYGVIGVYTVPKAHWTTGAHRVSWTLTHGPIPEGMHVLHRCDNPACVNPDHLWLGTNQDNIKDMTTKGRHLDGCKRSSEKRIGQKRSAETRQKMSAAKVNAVKEGKYPGARAVEINGIIYPTLKSAGKAHGLTSGAIAYWITIGRAKTCANTKVD